jgi:hypothetical protein
MANRKLERSIYNCREYRILRTAAKRHKCGLVDYWPGHYIESGEQYHEYVQMPGHDWNIGGKAPWRLRVCFRCIPEKAVLTG